jgi:hypothetical protein
LVDEVAVYVYGVFTHTVVVPVNVPAGFAFTFTVNGDTAPTHEVELVSVQLMVPVPTDVQFTVMPVVPCPLVIVPPLTVHAYPVIVPPVILLSEYDPVALRQVDDAPAMIAYGVALMVMLPSVAEPVQPVVVLVAVTVTLPVPAAPHSIPTVDDVDDPDMVPPVTLQL